MLNQGAGHDVESRAAETLALMHRWGYTPAVDALAASLLGGSVSGEHLKAHIAGSSRVRVEDGFAYLPGHEHLLEGSRRRVASHQTLNGAALAVAQEFTRDLVRVCPYVECVALSGSVASGGYGPADDVDFDLIVRSGTKYTSYLMATLVGLRYSWRYRHREVDELHRTPLLPKVICLNVVWTDAEARPFLRQDADMAFELMRCRPLFGTGRFREMLDENPWIRDYFPQAYEPLPSEDPPLERGALAGFVMAIGQVRGARQVIELASRGAVWALYHFVQWTRRRNPNAVQRNEFLRRVKAPYEVLQD